MTHAIRASAKIPRRTGIALFRMLQKTRGALYDGGHVDGVGHACDSGYPVFRILALSRRALQGRIKTGVDQVDRADLMRDAREITTYTPRN